MQFYARCGQLPLEPTHHCLTHSATVLSSASCMIDTLLAGLHLQVIDVSQVIIENLPIWNIPLDTFCQGFNCPRNSDIHPTHLWTIFSEQVDFVHTNQAILYTDGSKLHEQVGCAAVFAGECVGRRLRAESTVIIAELTAIRDALIIACNTQDQNALFFQILKVPFKLYRSTTIITLLSGRS